jgi:hypothetical protein
VTRKFLSKSFPAAEICRKETADALCRRSGDSRVGHAEAPPPGVTLVGPFATPHYCCVLATSVLAQAQNFCQRFPHEHGLAWVGFDPFFPLSPFVTADSVISHLAIHALLQSLIDFFTHTWASAFAPAQANTQSRLRRLRMRTETSS